MFPDLKPLMSWLERFLAAYEARTEALRERGK